MCANYGLDPLFGDVHFDDEADAELVEALRAWANCNAAETLRPTGRHLRNLNPIVVERDGAPVLEVGWWGLLVHGAPARFPSINTRPNACRRDPAGFVDGRSCRRRAGTRCRSRAVSGTSSRGRGGRCSGWPS